MARFDFSFFDSGARFDTPDANPSSSMKNLARYLDNPFDDKEISMNELVAFSTDHLQRMIANNPSGELTARITGTTSALDLVMDCVTDDTTRLGLRKARKQAKDDFRLGIPAAVEKIIAAAVAAYGSSSPLILEFCPSGRTIFTTCRDDQVEAHLQTLLNAVTAHQTDLLPATLTQATALKNNWVAAYTASESSTGNKTVSQEGKQLARENLQLMLFLNLCKLMEMFPRQPEKLALYMRQDLLENPERGEEPEPPLVPPTP
jgi:hypothetical protein